MVQETEMQVKDSKGGRNALGIVTKQEEISATKKEGYQLNQASHLQEPAPGGNCASH